MKNHPLVKLHLLEPLQDLLELLDEVQGDRIDFPIKMFLTFDEISTICEASLEPYTALRRIIRVMSDHPIWTFVLSTKSPLGFVAPSSSKDASSRVNMADLLRVPPFYTFPMDIEASRAMTENPDRMKSLPMAEYNRLSHLVLYGRPLWFAYRNYGCASIRSLALSKLLCEPSSFFKPWNEHHASAALSTRLCLDPCTKDSASVSLRNTAVTSHLRLILRMDSDHGLIQTLSPHEPILAEAVAYLLNSAKKPDGAVHSLWHETLNTLRTRILTPALIDKETIGELVSRLLLILAHDRALVPRAHEDFAFCSHLTVSDFLQSLFNSSHKSILETGMTVTTRAILDGHINFSHFVSTRTALSSDSMLDLLHNPLMEHAARLP